MKATFTVLLFLMILTTSAFAKKQIRKPSSSDCGQSEKGSVLHDLKNGQTLELAGIRFDKPYKDTIGCSDGSHGFFEYVSVGECLGVAIQDSVAGEYKWHTIRCH